MILKYIHTRTLKKHTYMTLRYIHTRHLYTYTHGTEKKNIHTRHLNTYTRKYSPDHTPLKSNSFTLPYLCAQLGTWGTVLSNSLVPSRGRNVIRTHRGFRRVVRTRTFKGKY